MDLFDKATEQPNENAPLAERMRPKNFNDFLGQSQALGDNSFLMKVIKQGSRLPNLILWGPPGTGKTTFARLIATRVDAEFLNVNAVDTGAKKLRELGQEAQKRKAYYSRHTILFVDEIHRLNKAQQDVLLPFSEKGDFTLIGATTENPSYELNAALLSRCRVVVFERHSTKDLHQLLKRSALELSVRLDKLLSEEAQEEVCLMCDGDARQLLGLFEQVHQYASLYSSEDNEAASLPLTKEGVHQVVESAPMYYDKAGDEHYDCISAFIKSIRGSDPDAALYYLARMIEGGENPVFLARRLVISASEDVGNADPRALPLAVAGLQAVELVGLPEAAINLAQVTTYLASAPKSNRAYAGLNKAKQVVKETGRLPVPKALRSSQTKLSRQLGHGQDYQYSHDGPKGYIEQEFLPQELKGHRFYEPVDRGFEKSIRQYLAWMKNKTSYESE